VYLDGYAPNDSQVKEHKSGFAVDFFIVLYVAKVMLPAERDGALAWWDCEEPLRAERAELRAGYEQEFIEEYGVQLELINTSLEETLRENS
jgi:hypothetical protein